MNEDRKIQAKRRNLKIDVATPWGSPFSLFADDNLSKTFIFILLIFAMILIYLYFSGQNHSITKTN